MRILRGVLAAALAGALLCGAALWALGSRLSAPALRPVGPPPDSLPARSLQIESGSGSRLEAWLVAGGPDRGGVVLAHSIRGDRRTLVSRAELLHRAGYHVLLFDAQAHGESEGERITFGHLESRDARAALARLAQEIPGRPLAYLGVSLGGAAALAGEPPLAADALVLEAVYPTLREAVANRIAIRLGPAGRALAPLLLLQLRPRLGFAPEELEPIRGMARMTAPVLVIAGETDRHTTLDQSRALFAAAPGPKELWVVPGAAHVDYLAADPESYRRRVLGFLERHLGSKR